MKTLQLSVKLKYAHPKQREFIADKVPRKVIRAGRRAGKTTGVAIYAIENFFAGKRVLYAAPTQEQVDSFWDEITTALAEPIAARVFYKNETRHLIVNQQNKTRIRAKTAWNADSLRGDYADILILDEYQLMSADTWGKVGAPMLLDNNGDAVFIFTQVLGMHHSKELYKAAKEDTSGRWKVYSFSSFDNPHLSRPALDDIIKDMSNIAYRLEIMAEEMEDDPRALWNRGIIKHSTSYPELDRIVVGVDPLGSAITGMCGIVAAGCKTIDDVKRGYVLADKSVSASPAIWGAEVVSLYNVLKANTIVGEVNYGGDMVRHVIKTVEGGEYAAYKDVRASRGKAIRAEPIVSLYERGLIEHIGRFDDLEDQMCEWVSGSGQHSPDRIDALVWTLSELFQTGEMRIVGNLFDDPYQIVTQEALNSW